jgi:hypothetical protein
MVNDALRARGQDESLLEGEGYFYFGGGEPVNWLSSSVMVRRISDLTLEEWLDLGQRREPPLLFTPVRSLMTITSALTIDFESGSNTIPRIEAFGDCASTQQLESKKRKPTKSTRTKVSSLREKSRLVKLPERHAISYHARHKNTQRHVPCCRRASVLSPISVFGILLKMAGFPATSGARRIATKHCFSVS